MKEFLELLIFGPEIENVSYGFLPILAAAAPGIISGIGSLFGRKRKRKAAQAAERSKNAALSKVNNFKFKNAYEGMQGASYDPVAMKAAQIGAAQTAEMPQLAESQGYESQGYTAQGTNVGPLLTGSATGLTNEFNNLQVSTAGAELAAQEADQALAASQDLAAQAGTGAGGATALAAAAAKSKASITADIDKQVKANEMRRAEGEMKLQRDQLAQSNIASQFNLGQQQFNAGQSNQAAQFTAAAQNQAAQFGAAAANQFALTEFGQTADMNKFNAGAQNQFTMQQFQADQAANSANQAAQLQALQFGAQSDFQARQLAAQGAADVMGMEYNRLAANLGMQSAEHGARSAAYEKQRGMLLGGLTSAAAGAASAFGGKG